MQSPTHRLCIVYAWSTHCLCMELYSAYARSMRGLCTTYAPLSTAYTPSMHGLCPAYASPVRGLYNAYTSPTYRLCIAYTWNYTAPMHGLCVAYAPLMHSLCTAYAPSMHHLCTDHTRQTMTKIEIHFNDNAHHKPVGHRNHGRLHRIRPVVAYLNELQSLVSYKALLSLNVFKSIASGYNRSLQSRKTYHLKSINYSMYSCQITYSINLLLDGKGKMSEFC
uniref:Uncharacterized protein n=1 Tax=Glossina palpalis gambiensis TaxID=67801 RepID=A0A1B0AQA9_9MUSC